MATVNERLSESLQYWRNIRKKNDYTVIHGKDTLGTTHTNRLLNSGYLQQIIKGLVYVITSRQWRWYHSLVHIFIGISSPPHANNRFGNEWSLSAEQSLAFYSGYYVIPKQVVIRATKASNNIIQLRYGDTLWRHGHTTNVNWWRIRNGLNIYSMVEVSLLFTAIFHY